eukprot:COSAG06_NODE_6392_length_2952_cov_2.691903_1_plen_195_part_00
MCVDVHFSAAAAADGTHCGTGSYPATIITCNSDGTYKVRYDDGSLALVECCSRCHRCRRCCLHRAPRDQAWPDQMQESITLPDGTTSAIRRAPTLVGLPIGVCSLVILQAGGESSTAVAIVAHVAVLVSTVGLLAACGFAAASHSAGNSSELPDCFLMGAVRCARVVQRATLCRQRKAQARRQGPVSEEELGGE